MSSGEPLTSDKMVCCPVLWGGIFLPNSGFDYGRTITQCQYSMRPQLDTAAQPSHRQTGQRGPWTKEIKNLMIDFQRPAEKQWSAPYWSAMHETVVTSPCENMKMYQIILGALVNMSNKQLVTSSSGRIGSGGGSPPARLCDMSALLTAGHLYVKLSNKLSQMSFSRRFQIS